MIEILISAQFLVEIVKELNVFRQIGLFVGVLITLQRNVSKESQRESKNLMRVVIRKIDEHNVCLVNVLDVDLNIT